MGTTSESSAAILVNTPGAPPRGAFESFRPFLLAAAERELSRDLLVKAGESDLVQETLLKAHRDLAGFRGRTEEEFRSWLLTILRNSVFELRRRYSGPGRDLKREERLESDLHVAGGAGGRRYDASAPIGAAIRSERAALLSEALGRLNDRQRQVVAWRQQEGCTFEEIGRRLGCATVTARLAWLHALERLREELSVLGQDSSLVVPEAGRRD